VAAMVRITGSSRVVGAAEDVLLEVRRAQTTVTAAIQAGTAAVRSDTWSDLEASFTDARDRFVNEIRAIRGGG